MKIHQNYNCIREGNGKLFQTQIIVRREIRPGVVVTSRWTMLHQGNRVMYIEADPVTGSDKQLVECSTKDFCHKFEGVEGVDRFGYLWGKTW